MKSNPLINHIYKLKIMMVDPSESGYAAWRYKQQLLEAKWTLDEILDEAPTFMGEDEWIEEQNTLRAFDQIKNSTRSR